MRCARDIGVEIRGDEEIIVRHQILDQRLIAVGSPGENTPVAIWIQRLASRPAMPQPLRRIISRAPRLQHLLRRQAEDEDVLGADMLRISTLAPSSVPMVSAPFSANFILPVPDASMPAVEICSERSAAGMIFSASDTR